MWCRRQSGPLSPPQPPAPLLRWLPSAAKKGVGPARQTRAGRWAARPFARTATLPRGGREAAGRSEAELPVLLGSRVTASVQAKFSVACSAAASSSTAVDLTRKGLANEEHHAGCQSDGLCTAHSHRGAQTAVESMASTVRCIIPGCACAGGASRARRRVNQPPAADSAWKLTRRFCVNRHATNVAAVLHLEVRSQGFLVGIGGWQR